MSRARWMVLAALGLVGPCAVGACAFPVAEEISAPVVDEADVDFYASDVHPLLEASCATLDCHGADRRPLRLYAETGRRARAELRGERITHAELEANVHALRILDPSEPDLDRRMVLLKPLARSADGAHHIGGDLWASRQHPGYVCLRAFLARTPDAPGVRDACAAAYDEVRLPDPDPAVP